MPSWAGLARQRARPGAVTYGYGVFPPPPHTLSRVWFYSSIPHYWEKRRAVQVEFAALPYEKKNTAARFPAQAESPARNP